MLAHGWMIDIMQIMAALYLGWLAWKSAKAAFVAKADTSQPPHPPVSGSFLRGLAIHLTNPKAILFFGAIYSVSIPVGTPVETVFWVAGAIGVQSVLIFVGLAVLFSDARVAAGYTRLKRPFEAVFATVFGAASIGFLVALLRRAPG